MIHELARVRGERNIVGEIERDPVCGRAQCAVDRGPKIICESHDRRFGGDFKLGTLQACRRDGARRRVFGRKEIEDGG